MKIVKVVWYLKYVGIRRPLQEHMFELGIKIIRRRTIAIFFGACKVCLL